MTKKNRSTGSGAVLEDVPIEQVFPYARNSRTHSETQVSQIAGSIKEFGFCNPVLIDGAGVIIAGHGRVLAAQRLGLETVPCIRLRHLTEAQKRAYVIADNRLALSSGWDEAMLMNELKDLKEVAEFDMALLGFDTEELTALLSEGWTSDIEVVKSSGSHTEGIKKIVGAQVDADSYDRARELIAAALTQEGIEFVLK